MRTHDLREVVLQDVELFIVMPRSLGPEGIRIGAVPETTPESRITALQAVMLVREGKVQGGRNGCRNLIIQTRVGSGTICQYPIGCIRDLEVVHRTAAEQLGELDSRLITGLNPARF